MKVICAWCKKDLGEKDGEGQEGQTSHGICPECYLKVKGSRDENQHDIP
jgi:hypothetical protein